MSQVSPRDGGWASVNRLILHRPEGVGPRYGRTDKLAANLAGIDPPTNALVAQ